MGCPGPATVARPHLGLGPREAGGDKDVEPLAGPKLHAIGHLVEAATVDTNPDPASFARLDQNRARFSGRDPGEIRQCLLLAFGQQRPKPTRFDAGAPPPRPFSTASPAFDS